MTNLDTLKTLLATNQMHHATARDMGVHMLCVYKADPTGFRGFRLVVTFLADEPDYAEACRLVSGTGISVGSYGGG